MVPVKIGYAALVDLPADSLPFHLSTSAITRAGSRSFAGWPGRLRPAGVAPPSVKLALLRHHDDDRADYQFATLELGARLTDPVIPH